MGVHEDLRQLFMAEAKGIRVGEVRIGPGCTVVLLESGQTCVVPGFHGKAWEGACCLLGVQPTCRKGGL